MKCQFCNREKVDRIFYVDWMGTVYQVPVCDSCLNKMWKRASQSGQTEEFKKYTGWWPGKQEPRHLGDRAFPEEAEPHMPRPAPGHFPPHSADLNVIIPSPRLFIKGFWQGENLNEL